MNTINANYKKSKSKDIEFLQDTLASNNTISERFSKIESELSACYHRSNVTLENLEKIVGYNKLNGYKTSYTSTWENWILDKAIPIALTAVVSLLSGYFIRGIFFNHNNHNQDFKQEIIARIDGYKLAIDRGYVQQVLADHHKEIMAIITKPNSIDGSVQDLDGSISIQVPSIVNSPINSPSSPHVRINTHGESSERGGIDPLHSLEESDIHSPSPQGSSSAAALRELRIETPAAPRNAVVPKTPVGRELLQSTKKSIGIIKGTKQPVPSKEAVQQDIDRFLLKFSGNGYKANQIAPLKEGLVALFNKEFPHGAVPNQIYHLLDDIWSDKNTLSFSKDAHGPVQFKEIFGEYKSKVQSQAQSRRSSATKATKKVIQKPDLSLDEEAVNEILQQNDVKTAHLLYILKVVTASIVAAELVPLADAYELNYNETLSISQEVDFDDERDEQELDLDQDIEAFEVQELTFAEKFQSKLPSYGEIIVKSSACGASSAGISSVLPAAYKPLAIATNHITCKFVVASLDASVHSDKTWIDWIETIQKQAYKEFANLSVIDVTKSLLSLGWSYLTYQSASKAVEAVLPQASVIAPLISAIAGMAAFQIANEQASALFDKAEALLQDQNIISDISLSGVEGIAA